MVYTELAPRRQKFHVTRTTMQQAYSAVSTTLRWILKNNNNNKQTKPRLKMKIKMMQSLIQNHMQHERSKSAREQSILYIKAINNNNNKVQCVIAGRRVWGVKSEPVEGGSRADMPEM